MKRSPIRKTNPERKKRRKDAGEVYGPLHEWVKRERCVLYGHPDHLCRNLGSSINESHHIVSVGAGGKDRNNTIPVCALAHVLFHSVGFASMCGAYGINFKALALEVTKRYEASL